MSTVVARRVESTPSRTAAQTWEKVVQILAPEPRSPAREELTKAAGVACSSISSEAIKEAPIVVWGRGPRVRIYGVFDDDAITGDGVNEDALSKSPTEGDWRMSIPCPPEDVQWSNKKLSAVTKRISARFLDDDVADETDSASAARSLTINAEEFLKP